jgi:hypothetical protein
MKCNSARTTSLALGSTIAILYSLCAIAMAVFPGAAFGFVRSVSHGVNLSALEIGTTPFTFGEFIGGLICITAYALVAGYLYGFFRNLLATKESEGPEVIRKAQAPARA